MNMNKNYSMLTVRHLVVECFSSFPGSKCAFSPQNTTRFFVFNLIKVSTQNAKKHRVQIKENLLQITKWIIIILVDILNEISSV